MQPKSPLESPHRVEDDLPPDSVLFGRSDVMQNLKRKLSRVCQTSIPVSLQGEMCTGKRVLCRFIHQHSAISAGRRMLPLNCSALSDWSGQILFNAALKSSTVIADTSAGGPRDASISTLFLNRVCDLPSNLQLKLSHLLADYDWNTKREESPAAVRILCTSTQDLRKEVRRGRFRRDLFDRVAVVTIEVPPLRKRLADLPEIIEYLGLRYAWQGDAAAYFPPDLLERMMAYSWPGNLCELESFVRRHIALKGDCSTPLHHAPETPRDPAWDWNWLMTTAASKRKM